MRSTRLNARVARRQAAGRVPPVSARMPRTEEWCRSNRRAIWCSDSPFYQRSHIGAFRLSAYRIRALRSIHNTPAACAAHCVLHRSYGTAAGSGRGQDQQTGRLQPDGTPLWMDVTGSLERQISHAGRRRERRLRNGNSRTLTLGYVRGALVSGTHSPPLRKRLPNLGAQREAAGRPRARNRHRCGAWVPAAPGTYLYPPSTRGAGSVHLRHRDKIEQLQQLFRLERFDQVMVEPGALRAFAVGLVPVAGQCDQDRTFARGY